MSNVTYFFIQIDGFRGSNPSWVRADQIVSIQALDSDPGVSQVIFKGGALLTEESPESIFKRLREGFERVRV